MGKVYYASTTDRDLVPCSIELLIDEDGKVYCRETILKSIHDGKTVEYKKKWELTALSPLSIKNKPAHLAHKFGGEGFYNAINFRGRVLNRIMTANLNKVGPKS